MGPQIRQSRQNEQEVLDKAKVQQWIKNGPTTNLIAEAEQFGKKLKERGLTTSQIRQVFTKLKAIEAKGFSGANKLEFLMLKPYLAYAAGRHSSVRPLKKIIDFGIDSVVADDKLNEQTKFKNFCKLFEAILAYHRAHGGK